MLYFTNEYTHYTYPVLFMFAYHNIIIYYYAYFSAIFGGSTPATRFLSDRCAVQLLEIDLFLLYIVSPSELNSNNTHIPN